MILEDDAVMLDNYDEDYYGSLMSEYDFVYLQRNENEPDKVKELPDPRIEVPAYPYNLTAYIITPKAAKILMSTPILSNIIPADEYVPLMIKNFKTCALKEDAFKQESREEFGSDTEPTSEEDYLIDFNTFAVTCGTDRKKCVPVMDSSTVNNIYPINIGNNVDWKGGDMTTPGGGMKVNLLRDFIADKRDEDVILFTDAYDVFYADDFDTIVKRYLSFDTEVVFSAEKYCYPDESLADQFPSTEYPYKYLNSGTFIGRIRTIKKMLEEGIEDSDDDQLFYQKKFLSGKFDAKLDNEQYIFTTHDDSVIKRGNQLFNPNTNCYGCIYHGNGGESSKAKFDQLFNQFYPKSPTIFIPNYGRVDYMDTDLLVVNFMTQSQCEDLIAMGDANGSWEPHPDDKFPAQEIRLKELGLWEECEKHWEKYIYPIVEKHWHPIQMYGLREAFIMKYTLDTQTSLANHHDASLVTGSVKLNEDYEGADLYFPRQNFSNKNVPVGRAILFPGQVTHGHQCNELTAGTKYSLTMWTQRYKGDLL
jgi:hypothetical protein